VDSLGIRDGFSVVFRKVGIFGLSNLAVLWQSSVACQEVLMTMLGDW
jgi:hypothetical protein